MHTGEKMKETPSVRRAVLHAARSTGGRAVWISCAVLAAAYLALCLVAAGSVTVFPNVYIEDVCVAGMTRAEAADAVAAQRETLAREIAIPVYLDGAPVGQVTTTQLGAVFDAPRTARAAYDAPRRSGFLSGGWAYLRCLTAKTVLTPRFSAEMSAVRACAEAFSEGVNRTAADGSYRVADGRLYLTRQNEGEDVAVATLQSSLYDALRYGEYDRADCIALRTEGAPLDLAAVQSVLSENRNAAYDKESGVITEEKAGVTFDLSEAEALLASAAPGQEVSLRAEVTAPEVTKAWLTEALFRDTLGRYATYAAGGAERLNNIRLSAEKINGTVLNAGETFSFNEAMGDVTAGGFVRAAVNPGDPSGALPGGGVSQTASTLYHACMLSDLEIIRRRSHTFAPDFITFGCDAAVCDGANDFVFRNDTDYPVRITAALTGNTLEITVQGSKTDDTSVRIITQTVSTTAYQTVYRKTDTLPAGQTAEEQTPCIGYSVRTYRNVYDGAGELLSAALEASSEYEARDRIVLTGTAAPVATPEQKPPET